MILYGLFCLGLIVWTVICVRRWGPAVTKKGVRKWIEAMGGYSAWLLLKRREKHPGKSGRQVDEALALLAPMESSGHRKMAFYTQLCGAVSVLLWAGMALGLCIGLSGVMEQELHTLERDAANSRQVTLRADAGEEKDILLTVELQPRHYTGEKVRELFDWGEARLEQWILGDNPSLDQVTSDLDLLTAMPGTQIQIDWTLDNYEIMDGSGVIDREKVPEEGRTVELTARFSYEDQERICRLGAFVLRGGETPGEQLKRHIKEAVETAEEETLTQSGVELPRQVDGQKVTYRQEESVSPMTWCMLCMAAAAALWAGKKKDLERQLAVRNREMLRDYPEMVSKFSLLLEAGMTVGQAWERIVKDYLRQKEQYRIKKRYVYEEMLFTLREIRGGMAQGDAYDRFGRRCRLQPYMRFCSLLLQNLKGGAGGLTEQLRIEADGAMETRKRMAREAGEETGTKLLLPMVLLLVVVIVILVVPAFMTVDLS